MKLYANIRKKFGKNNNFKSYCEKIKFRHRIQRVEIKTAGLIFRIFSDTVGQTAMM